MRSRALYGQEILVAYNISGQARNDCVIIDAALHPEPSQMRSLYGKPGNTPVKTAPDGSRFVQLNLAPHQFVVLS